MRNAIKMAAAALVFGSLTGCATPRYLIDDFTMGDRAVKYVMTPSGASVDTGGKSKEQLYNFIVRICDLDKQSNETACRDTTVVENVFPKSVY